MPHPIPWRPQSLFGDRLPQRELGETMKRLLAGLVLCASISTSAQVVYPYNPDANGDSQITSGDLLDFLPVFASSFTPQVITIDGLPLDEWLANLEGVVNSNASSIESLFAMQSQINALGAANSDLQNQINSLQDQLDNFLFSADGFPECVDIDVDGICDYADACPPIPLQFGYGSDGFSGDFLESDYLVSNGTYQYAFLGSVDLSGACLVGIDLSASNLTWTNLSDANLSGANLCAVNLNSAILANADLSGANLFGSSIPDANLSGANLSGATLTNVYLSGANLSGANLSGADLSGANGLFDAIFTGANLIGAMMTCLYDCPYSLPSGYTCEPDPDCWAPGHYRIVPE